MYFLYYFVCFYAFVLTSADRICGNCVCYETSKTAVCRGDGVESVDLGSYTGKVQHLLIKNTNVEYMELDPSFYFQLQEVTLKDNPFISCDTLLRLYVNYRVNTDSNILLCDKLITLQTPQTTLDTAGEILPSSRSSKTEFPNTVPQSLKPMSTMLPTSPKRIETTKNVLSTSTLQPVREVQDATFTEEFYQHPLFSLLASGVASLLSIVCLILVCCTQVRLRSVKLEMQRIKRECERRMTEREGHPLERYRYDEEVTAV